MRASLAWDFFPVGLSLIWATQKGPPYRKGGPVQHFEKGIGRLGQVVCGRVVTGDLCQPELDSQPDSNLREVGTRWTSFHTAGGRCRDARPTEALF